MKIIKENNDDKRKCLIAHAKADADLAHAKADADLAHAIADADYNCDLILAEDYDIDNYIQADPFGTGTTK